jgi:hypothetical protein
MAVPEAEHVAHDGHHGRGPSEGHPRGEPSLNEVFPVISNEFATKWLTRHNFWEKQILVFGRALYFGLKIIFLLRLSKKV